MANLGNAWHIPSSPEPRNLAGMRSPIGSVVSGTTLTIFSGNQYQGDGNPGNQLQDGSALFFKAAADAEWQAQPLSFASALANNKYFAATIPPGTFQTGTVVQYYLRIAYDDHDTTFVLPNGDLSITTDSEAAARAAPFTFTVEDRAVKGQWGPVFELPNVAIHTHVLPNGRVLMWGRRDDPNGDLDAHVCTPFVWDPADKTGQALTNTAPPRRADGTTVNLFCSGHSFLPDGRLLVVGGHQADSDGLSQASLYDCNDNTWTPTAAMTTPAGAEVRRWYPSATTLPDGTVLVTSGSYIDPSQPPGKQTINVDLLQVWHSGSWQAIGQAPFALPLYPRMHVAGDGRVFMSGTNALTRLLNTSPPSVWTDIGSRSLGARDYAPAVMYDADKIAYIGGGNDANTLVPSADVEIIDLSAAAPQWNHAASMHNRRRQHNATVLPDGTVLVTGGTRGGGGPNPGFNDLGPGQPVHVAELWDPVANTWSELTAEDVPRCYHSTAVLLPDATVLSAGGGEYRPVNGGGPNDPEDSHRNAQRFSPPYLFKGPQPRITGAPQSVDYGDSFQVTTPQAADIVKVTWIALPSVTHSFDEHQRVNFLEFMANATGLAVTAPASPNECPPGHYMLFLVNQAGVPSTASIVQIRVNAAVAPSAARAKALESQPVTLVSVQSALDVAPKPRLQLYTRAAHVERAAQGTPVLVGLTGTCPYGIGACWGGAYEALAQLEAVELVGPVPNADDSTADVFLCDERLPPLDSWQRQFQRVVNGSYQLRGVEVTLVAAIELRTGELFLLGTAKRPALRLSALSASDKLQWDHAARAPQALKPNEALAYARLAEQAQGPHTRIATVTGPLVRSAGELELRVRVFSLST